MISYQPNPRLKSIKDLSNLKFKLSYFKKGLFNWVVSIRFGAYLLFLIHLKVLWNLLVHLDGFAVHGTAQGRLSQKLAPWFTSGSPSKKKTVLYHLLFVIEVLFLIPSPSSVEKMFHCGHRVIYFLLWLQYKRRDTEKESQTASPSLATHILPQR